MEMPPSGMQKYQSSVYVWGSAAHGALGCGAKAKVQPVPRRLARCCEGCIRGSAIAAVAGNGFSTVVTDEWEVFSWGGGGGGGNRGAPPAKTKSSCPTRKIPLGDVLSVAHGTCHHCAVTLDGEVYGWGENTYGNLGEDDVPSSSSNDYGRRKNDGRRRRVVAHPRKIVGDFVSNVKAVACGEKHTCILKQNGDLLTMGANDAGQLGIGLSHDRHKGRNGCLSPHAVRAGVPFKEIACGNNHCVAISSEDGAIYSFGWGKHGRLGHGNEKLYNQPTRVEALSDLVPFATVACGSAHTLAATEDGDVWGFGWNTHGQVIGMVDDGRDDASYDDCLLPVICLAKKGVVQLSCSPFHSGAITAGGSLFLWGMNEDGQCGAGHELPILTPSRVDFQNPDGTERYVVSVSCGQSHTVCVTSNYMPMEATDMINRLKKYLSSAQIIIKFARYVIFRLRLLRLRQNKQKTTPQIQTATEKPRPEESPEKKQKPQIDDSSSLSSHSSWSNDPYSLDEAPGTTDNNELSQRLIEMQKMSDEDLRSSAHRAHLRALWQRASEAQKLAAEKKRMQEEDVLSRKLRAHTKRRQGETKRTKKQKSRAATARDSRTNEHILKAAQRLKMARERREQQTNAKKILPPAPERKSTKRELRTNSKCPPLHDIANNKQKSEAELARLRRRSKLVRQRETRLKTREEAAKEAAQVRRRNLKKKQEADRRQHADRMMELEKERRIAEEAKKLKLVRKMAELQRMEAELKLNRSLTQLRDENEQDKENQGGFYDLNHWTKSLSGVS